MKIEVKENYIILKEKSGIKPCTLRKLDGADIIEITNTDTGEKIRRTITDITEWKGELIISFK
jgi:hypothetical protein